MLACRIVTMQCGGTLRFGTFGESMPVSGGLRFEYQDGRPAENASFSIDDLELPVLRGYVHEAVVLQETVEAQGGFGANLQISWKEGQEVSFDTEEPTDAQRAAVLHRLRPFLLQKEPFYFHTIRGIVARSSTSAALQELLRTEKYRFAGKILQGTVKISIEDLLLNSESTLDMWLNAFEYHRDPAKADELLRLHDPYAVERSRPIFIFLLQEKTIAILNLASLIHKMLDRSLSNAR